MPQSELVSTHITSVTGMSYGLCRSDSEGWITACTRAERKCHALLGPATKQALATGGTEIVPGECSKPVTSNSDNETVSEARI